MKKRMDKISENNCIFSTFWGPNLTIRQAYEGIHVFGATGSGKTSTLKIVAKNMLSFGLGGIVLCDKPDEAINWNKYGIETKREQDFLFLSKEKFNFLNYESERNGGGDSENIANIILEVTGKSNKSTNDPFWDNAISQIIRNSVDLLKMAEENISLKSINQVIQSAPKSQEDMTKLNGSWFENITVKARKSAHFDNEIVLRYWLDEFLNLSEKTRSIIISSFTGIVDKLSRGKIGQIFNTETTFNFEDLRKGKILICDLSNKEYGEVGRFSNILIKYMFQKMVERKCSEGIPAFIWADEAQFFISKNDNNFLQTARSSKIINVYITQNIHNYYSELGLNNKSNVNSLLGNFQTKLFFQNGDNDTNKFAADLLGKAIFTRLSTHHGGSNSYTKSENLEYRLEPDSFFDMYKGGKDYNNKVSFIMINPNWIKLYQKKFFYLIFNQMTGKFKNLSLKALTNRNYKPPFVQLYETTIGIGMLIGIIWGIVYYFRH